MAEFDFLDDFGISAQDAEQPKNAYDRFIIELSNKLAEEFRDYTKKVASNTGALAASIIPVPTGQLSFRLEAEDYYPFVDEGVNAVGTNNYGSQFSFNYPGVSHNMATAISQWKGLDMSHAYAVASNIKQRGLQPKRITENVINDSVLERIGRDLAELTGLLFEINFTKNGNNTI
ncbi:hypothetical protein UFOVP775_32 [uncultured Caudovirales phage]|uniref:Uncharacterized protein n=1 Tax=uncultured Caudovirales phage TaxID=2100421 RepID=A0A6J5NZ59_9CAUD|nr:hypothetical protein UFOVP775_32 [uncultured Caudovirales phage]